MPGFVLLALARLFPDFFQRFCEATCIPTDILIYGVSTRWHSVCGQEQLSSLKNREKELAFTLATTVKSLVHKRSSLWFWIVLIVVVLFLIALPYSPTFRNYAGKATDWAEAIMSRNPITGGAVFFLFA